MLRFLIILLLIGLIVAFLNRSIKKKLNDMFSVFRPQNPIDKQEKKDEVIYRKDNVVVLKGDAKKNEDKKD